MQVSLVKAALPVKQVLMLGHRRNAAISVRKVIVFR
jgi:hypothetical protein